ncbi:hypothetical protein XENTR_v10006616 [Xenopus tropicalis]|nr:hypothetical protein XENTR_v10006616 [Xenopus tropicalis]
MEVETIGILSLSDDLTLNAAFAQVPSMAANQNLLSHLINETADIQGFAIAVVLSIVHTRTEYRTKREKRRKDAIAAATTLTEALVDHLNVGVAQAYVNQRKLDHEVKTLQTQAAQFAKQTTQWISLVENFNQALKEIGDVENWARSIEKDMRIIATALEYVYKGQLQPSAS